MFSPAKAITAGALVFAIGGVLLIAQPFDQQGGGVPGAATDEEREAPDEFTGQWSFGGEVLPATLELGSGWSGSRGGAWRYGAIDVTDPRFDGEVIAFENWDDIRTATGEYSIRRTAWRVENEDGWWQSEVLTAADFLDGSQTSRTFTFDGGGEYAGLTAIVEETPGSGFSSDVRGVIIDFDLPPDPEPPSLQ